MTNHQVFEAFAEGRSGSAANVRSEHMSSGRTVLYSYNTPIAIRDGGAVIVDDRRYSVTTSKQTTQSVMPCIRAGLTWDRIPHDRFRAICQNIGADLRYAR